MVDRNHRVLQWSHPQSSVLFLRLMDHEPPVTCPRAQHRNTQVPQLPSCNPSVEKSLRWITTQVLHIINAFSVSLEMGMIPSLRDLVRGTVAAEGKQLSQTHKQWLRKIISKFNATVSSLYSSHHCVLLRVKLLTLLCAFPCVKKGRTVFPEREFLYAQKGRHSFWRVHRISSNQLYSHKMSPPIFAKHEPVPTQGDRPLNQ
jgi:hypothetical protein